MQKHSTEQLLSMAFDEGAEAPYELKEDIIASLLEKNNEKPGNGGEYQKEAATYLEHSLVPEILKFIRIPRGKSWLAGGSIARTLIKPKQWASDYDIFCDAEGLSVIQGYANMEEAEPHTQKDYSDNNEDIQRTYKLKSTIGGRAVHIIVASNWATAADVVKNFDFTICQFAYTECKSLGKSLYGAEKAWSHLRANEIHLTPHAISHKQNSNAQLERVEKYIHRGFRDMTGTVERGFLFDFKSKT